MNPFLLPILLSSSLIFASQGSGEPSPCIVDNCSQIQEPPACPVACNPCDCLNNLIRIGGSYNYLWLSPEGEATFTGPLWGAQGIYEYRPQNAIYEAVTFTYRQGHPSGVEEGEKNTRKLLNFDVQGRIGYTFAPSQFPWWNTTLFCGLGYWYMGQTLEQPDFIDVEFNYNEFYIPLGFSTVTYPLSYLNIGLNFIWMPQVYPAVTIIPTGGANWILEKALSNFLVELPITFKLFCKENFHLEIKPFFEYWRDRQTIAETTNGIPLGVPGNTYLLPGIQLNFGGAF